MSYLTYVGPETIAADTHLEAIGYSDVAAA
jgi:hypothetical protein